MASRLGDGDAKTAGIVLDDHEIVAVGAGDIAEIDLQARIVGGFGDRLHHEFDDMDVAVRAGRGLAGTGADIRRVGSAEVAVGRIAGHAEDVVAAAEYRHFLVMGAGGLPAVLAVGDRSGAEVFEILGARAFIQQVQILDIRSEGEVAARIDGVDASGGSLGYNIAGIDGVGVRVGRAVVGNDAGRIPIAGDIVVVDKGDFQRRATPVVVFAGHCVGDGDVFNIDVTGAGIGLGRLADAHADRCSVDGAVMDVDARQGRRVWRTIARSIVASLDRDRTAEFMRRSGAAVGQTHIGEMEIADLDVGVSFVLQIDVDAGAKPVRVDAGSAEGRSAAQLADVVHRQVEQIRVAELLEVQPLLRQMGEGDALDQYA